MMQAQRLLTRVEAEDFLYHEAALLDEWRLKEWLELLTPDVTYRIPPNDKPDGDPRDTLFIIADDAERIRQRVIRILDPNCHAEAPRSRIRRHISNVRVLGQEGDVATVAANFICHRFRRHERIREYVGGMTYRIKLTDAGLRIKERRIVIDAHELGSLGSVSFLL
jgi:p-cumate 2,3-dioxygenase beta subunit